MNSRLKPALMAIFLLALVLAILLSSRTNERASVPIPALPEAKQAQSRALASPQSQQELRTAQIDVAFVDELQAAMLWSNTYPEQAVRYAAVVSSINAPVHYYGLCVDQDGKPLSGVSITMRIRQWQGISPLDLKGAALRFPRTSDVNGRFELVGVKADVATVESASLAGYEWIRSGVSIDFSVAGNRVPRPGNPVVLQFWKKLPPEPMYAAGSTLRQKIPCDGTSSFHDLKSGLPVSQTTDTSVEFRMQRDPVTLNASTTNRPSWKLTVEIPGGAVQLAATNMPFVAPAEGYAGQAAFGFEAGDVGWASRTNATLFYRTGAGTYGRLDFTITATTDGPVAALNWNSHLNPSGSRVLEYDPARRLKAPSGTPSPAFRGAAQQPAQPVGGAQPSAQKVAPPFVLQPPPGFQALTNRAAPPRPQ